MPSPLIGITTSRIQARVSFQAVKSTYVDAIASADGLPALIPTGVTEPSLTELMARIDGILLSGGGDIDPARYLQPPPTELLEVDPERDAMEIAIVRLAAEGRKPLLAICRGLQVANVALGGDLCQDIAASLPTVTCHDQPDGAEHDAPHEVEIHEGSQLRRIVGAPRLGTNSFHHQAAARIDGPRRGRGRGGAGARSIGLCVQWHPEKMPGHPVMHSIFAAFIGSSRVR